MLFLYMTPILFAAVLFILAGKDSIFDLIR